MNFRLFLTILLIAMTIMSCKKDEVATLPPSSPLAVETRGLNLQPVYISTDKVGQIGYGTWVTDPTRGEYLVTARHLFNQSRQYYIGYSTNGVSMTYRPILGVDEKSTEVCVAKIGPVGADGPVFSTAQSQTSNEIEKRIRGGTQINLTIKPPGVFTSVLGKNSVSSVAEWSGLPDQIQALDCYLGRGSSGTGFTRDGDTQTFWVIFGGWPEMLTPQMKDLSQQKDLKGFTTICGQEWSQIEEARKNLFGK